MFRLSIFPFFQQSVSMAALRLAHEHQLRHSSHNCQFGKTIVQALKHFVRSAPNRQVFSLNGFHAISRGCSRESFRFSECPTRFSPIISMSSAGWRHAHQTTEASRSLQPNCTVHFEMFPVVPLCLFSQSKAGGTNTN